MRPSKLLVTGILGFLSGVLLLSIILFSWLLFFTAFVLALSLFVIGAAGHEKTLVVSVFVIFLTLGFMRASFAGLPAPDNTVRAFSGLRENLVNRSSATIGGAEHAMFSAMVLGDRTKISENLNESFNRTGTSHILSISGMHLTIVAGFLWSALITLGLWRKQATWAAILFMALFVLLVGSPPSAVRAFIMASLYLWARTTGRVPQSWRVILLAGALMVLFSPSLLFGSLGFQLSFLAVLGISIFKPFFDSALSFIAWDPVRDLLSISLSAQLTTWPLVAMTFKTFSVAGIFVNLVVVPLLPLVMILGLLFALVGWVPVVASALLYPVWVLLRVIRGIVEWAGALPYAALEVASFTPLLLLVYYAALIGIWRVFRKYDISLSI